MFHNISHVSQHGTLYCTAPVCRCAAVPVVGNRPGTDTGNPVEPAAVAVDSPGRAGQAEAAHTRALPGRLSGSVESRRRDRDVTGWQALSRDSQIH